MGDSTTSMFYLFAIVLVLYFVGVGIYQLFQMVKKWRKKQR